LVDGEYPDISQIEQFVRRLFEAKLKVQAKTIQFILNLESWQNLVKDIDLLAILRFDAAI